VGVESPGEKDLGEEEDAGEGRYARVDHVHTTLEARVKVALAATAGEDLSLDHELMFA
jgi:hypothetical protein